ncbi:excisionase family DNA-binding protein [Streptomyces sp. NPDC002405]
MVRRDLPPGAQRLLCSDGSVAIPAALAARVLHVLLRDVGARARVNSGALAPGIGDVLWALHGAARTEDERLAAAVGTPACSVGGTPVAGPVSVEISASELAERMGCSREYVRRLARSGRVPARRVGRAWLITAEAEEQVA